MERRSWHAASWEEFGGWVVIQCGEDTRRPRSERRFCYTTPTASQLDKLGGKSHKWQVFRS